jgi:chromosome segregation ATPase
MQGTFSENPGNVPGAIREHSDNIQGTFREHAAPGHEVESEAELLQENSQILQENSQLLQENSHLKEQLRMVANQRDKAEMTLQEVRRETWVANQILQNLQEQNEYSANAYRELQERTTVASEERERQVAEVESRYLQVNSRCVQVERANATLKADLANRQAELRAKEKQLQMYEDSLFQMLDGNSL